MHAPDGPPPFALHAPIEEIMPKYACARPCSCHARQVLLFFLPLCSFFSLLPPFLTVSPPLSVEGKHSWKLRNLLKHIPSVSTSGGSERQFILLTVTSYEILKENIKINQREFIKTLKFNSVRHERYFSNFKASSYLCSTVQRFVQRSRNSVLIQKA